MAVAITTALTQIMKLLADAIASGTESIGKFVKTVITNLAKAINMPQAQVDGIFKALGAFGSSWKSFLDANVGVSNQILILKTAIFNLFLYYRILFCRPPLIPM